MKKLIILCAIALMVLLLVAPVVGCKQEPSQETNDIVEVIRIFKAESPDYPPPPGGWISMSTGPHPSKIQEVFDPGDKMFLGLVISEQITNEVKFSRFTFFNKGTGTEEEKDQGRQIALADKTVQEVIGNRGYKLERDIIRDGWQETREGKAYFYIFPRVEFWLHPTISDIVDIYVDLDQKKVVRIFTESHLSPMPLQSSAADRDFTLTIQIPKTDYKVGETAEAIMTLSYTGDEPVELTAPDSQYFNLTIRGGQGNIVYQWERQEYGPPPPPLDWFKETINPGQTITKRLEFSLPEAGTFYIEGRNFGGWDYGQALADYPDGHGYGLYIDTPFIVINAH